MTSTATNLPESLDSALLALSSLWRMVGVGGICILQLLQNTKDLAAACSNSHHFDNSELTRPEPEDDSPTLV